MKKAEIASLVFQAVEGLPPSRLDGRGLDASVSDWAALALVPWFCDVSVQWAARITQPGTVLKKGFLQKTSNTHASVAPDGALLIGIPGDGMEPNVQTLKALAESILKAAPPGITLELAAANLGVVKRDRDARAETAGTSGHQRYVGTVGEGGLWTIQSATPPVTASVLAVALDCGRMVLGERPWQARDKTEAHNILLRWLQSPQANVNPLAVKRFISLQGTTFSNSDPGMTRKLCGLGLGFFRERLADSPFRWDDSGPVLGSPQQLAETLQAVVG